MLFMGLITLLTSCGNKNKIPEGVIRPEKMQAVLWDILRADVFTRDFISKDSATNAVDKNLAMQREIFAMHHISKAEFYSSYAYYNENARLLKEIMDSMIVKADRSKEKIIIKPLQAD